VTITMTASGGAPSYTYALTATAASLQPDDGGYFDLVHVVATANGTYNLGRPVTGRGRAHGDRYPPRHREQRGWSGRTVSLP